MREDGYYWVKRSDKDGWEVSLLRTPWPENSTLSTLRFWELFFDEPAVEGKEDGDWIIGSKIEPPS
jgi:hypothetical protein